MVVYLQHIKRLLVQKKNKKNFKINYKIQNIKKKTENLQKDSKYSKNLKIDIWIEKEMLYQNRDYIILGKKKSFINAKQIKQKN